MGFLDELKKLAENRSGNSDGLLIDTLRKTNAATGKKCLPGMKVVKQLHPDDQKRKQHGKKRRKKKQKKSEITVIFIA